MFNGISSDFMVFHMVSEASKIRGFALGYYGILV